MKNPRVAMFAGAIVMVVGVVQASAMWPMPARGAAEPGFQFGVIGDLGYAPAQEPMFANVLEDLNAAPLDFVFHLGDLAADENTCRDEDYRKRLAQFQASVHPFIYTPGDNDWTDCHRTRPTRPSYGPLERLAKLRELFFGTEETLGKRTVPVWRESRNPVYAKYWENMRFSFRDVTVITVHLPGSNNNFGRTPEMDVEWAERNEANVVWLVDGFAEAKRLGNKGVVIFTQANMFGDFTPSDPDTGFVDFKQHLLTQTIAFGKPVVLFNGDTHNF